LASLTIERLIISEIMTSDVDDLMNGTKDFISRVYRYEVGGQRGEGDQSRVRGHGENVSRTCPRGGLENV
jgi:hypothetical protein